MLSTDVELYLEISTLDRLLSLWLNYYSSFLPFSTDRSLVNVMMQKYEWSRKDAEELSDFLVPMMDYVPSKRATAAQCLKHPWLQQHGGDNKKQEQETMVDGDDGDKGKSDAGDCSNPIKIEDSDS